MSKLRLNITLGTLSILGLCLVAVGGQRLYWEVQQQVQAVKTQGRQAAINLAQASVVPIQNFQLTRLPTLVAELQRDPYRQPNSSQSERPSLSSSATPLHIVYGVILIQAGPNLIGPERYLAGLPQPPLPTDSHLEWIQVPIQPDPTFPDPSVIGAVRIAVDLEPAYDHVRTAAIPLIIFFGVTVLIVSVGLNLFLEFLVITPVIQLTRSARQLAAGQFVEILLTERQDELGLLSQIFNDMSRRLAQRTQSLEETNALLQQANQELERQANQDGLTQLANRRCFDHYLEQEWQRASREKQPISLLLCDVDFFKRYNDSYGHQAGDACLQSIAAVLQSSLRRPTDLAVRYGGEELAIILPNTDQEGSLYVAGLIQNNLAALQIPHNGSLVDLYVTLSIGACTVIPTGVDTYNQLIAAADQALYRAKSQGRNQIVWQDFTN